MQKVLITGANGFLGFYLVKELLDKQIQILATGKGPSRLPFQSAYLHYETLDFTDETEAGNIINQFQPGIVVHCGAMSKPDECEQNREAAFLTNVSATIYLLRHAAVNKCFFIFLSTDFVFDGTKGMYSEEDVTGPVNYYGKTKLLAEEEVKHYPFGYAIVRTILVYGKTFLNRQNLVTNTAQSLKKNEKLKIFNDQVRTPTFVEDLASAIVTIIEKKATGIFHISGEDVLTPYEIAVETARYQNLDETLITPVNEDEFLQPARRPLRTGFNISKAKKILNYQPTSFKEGLKKTFE